MSIGTVDIVGEYLNSFMAPQSLEKMTQWPRVVCCGSSRSLYCPECYSLLIPKEEWPKESFQALPFVLHIILHDRRNAATGLHAKVLAHNFGLTASEVQIFDLERLDPLPKEFPRHSYLLFPSEDSVPLESVRHKVETLVVLDCKWTRSSARNHPCLAKLPRVHLTVKEHQTRESYFWRWHSAGPNCLSTMEAIYEAACEMKPTPKKQWLTWLWLFGLQRAAAGGVSSQQKLKQQDMRHKRGTEKQQRDKERGRLLSEQHRLQRDSGEIMGEARKPQWQIHLEKTSNN